MKMPENIDGFEFADGEDRLSREQPYAVPEGFFDQFASSVMARIRQDSDASAEIAGLSPLLAGISRIMPFEVPTGYFDQLLEDAVVVNSPEIHPSFGFGVAMPYEVPAGYFETLQPLRKQAPVVSMARRWRNMAVAAAVAALVAMTGIVMFTSKGGKAEDEFNNLASVPTTTMDAFLDATDPANNNKATASGNITEVKTLLKDVSDKELDEFLEDLPVFDESSYN